MGRRTTRKTLIGSPGSSPDFKERQRLARTVRPPATTPSPRRERRRVLRPGGRLGLACAKPEGTAAACCVRSRYASLPTGVAEGRPDSAWDLLSEGFEEVALQDTWFPIVASSAGDAGDRWLSGFGPMRQTYAALNGPDREALSGDCSSSSASSSSRGSKRKMIPQEALLVTALARDGE